MKYIDYVKYLNSKNIKMFDHDIRVSYNNIMQYYFKNQKGGGNKIAKNDDELIEILRISLSTRPENLYFLTKH